MPQIALILILTCLTGCLSYTWHNVRSDWVGQAVPSASPLVLIENCNVGFECTTPDFPRKIKARQVTDTFCPRLYFQDINPKKQKISLLKPGTVITFREHYIVGYNIPFYPASGGFIVELPDHSLAGSPGNRFHIFEDDRASRGEPNSALALRVVKKGKLTIDLNFDKQKFKEDGWEDLMEEFRELTAPYHIKILTMEPEKNHFTVEVDGDGVAFLITFYPELGLVREEFDRDERGYPYNKPPIW